MKRKLLKILFIGIICFSLVGCNNKDNLKVIIKDTAELNEAKGVTMTIKKGTLTRTGATIIITDLSGKSNIYGEFYRIDKKENGIWIPLKSIDGRDWTEFNWTLHAYTVGSDKKLELELNWEYLYGELENGEYRIVKDTLQHSEYPNNHFSLGNEINKDTTNYLDNRKYYFSVEFIIE